MNTVEQMRHLWCRYRPFVSDCVTVACWPGADSCASHMVAHIELRRESACDPMQSLRPRRQTSAPCVNVLAESEMLTEAVRGTGYEPGRCYVEPLVQLGFSVFSTSHLNTGTSASSEFFS